MGLFDYIGSQLLKAIEWEDNTKDTIVYRYPMNGRKIMMGSKLTVRESQVAIFVNKGKIADVFGPGMYKLAASNLPFLSNLLGWAYGFKSPFFSEVYFVNTKQFTNQKWGTTNPITLRDPEFGAIRIRGFGSYSFRVHDAKKLLQELFGTNSTFTTQDIVEHLKSILVMGISDTIAESKISALDLAANLMEFTNVVKTQLTEKFNDLGLELASLIIENFSFPEAVEKAIDTRSSMGVMADKMDDFVKYQAANALRESANNTSGNMASAGVGIGSGMVMGNMMASVFSQNNQNNAQKPAPQPQQTNTKYCPNCGKQCDANAKFCPDCGMKFENKVCPNCGVKLEAGTKFCPNCGNKI